MVAQMTQKACTRSRMLCLVIKKIAAHGKVHATNVAYIAIYPMVYSADMVFNAPTLDRLILAIGRIRTLEHLA